MKLNEVIGLLKANHDQRFNLNPAAIADDIIAAESKIGFELPVDFKEFYFNCNGFDCTKEDFAFNQLKDMFRDNDFGKDCAVFADYKTYTVVWVLRILDAGKYEIFCSEDEETVLTNSLTTFLEKILLSNIAVTDGLLKWQEERSGD